MAKDWDAVFSQPDEWDAVFAPPKFESNQALQGVIQKPAWEQPMPDGGPALVSGDRKFYQTETYMPETKPDYGLGRLVSVPRQVIDRAAAGLKSGVGGLIEPTNQELGRKLQAEAAGVLQTPHNAKNIIEQGLYEAAPSLPAMASYLLPVVGPAAGTVLMAGQTYAGPEKWNVPKDKRSLSASLQTGVETVGNIPEYAIINSALPAGMKAMALPLTTLVTNLIEEAAQGEIEASVERGQKPDLNRALQTAYDSLPATVAMMGMGAVLPVAQQAFQEQVKRRVPEIEKEVQFQPMTDADKVIQVTPEKVDWDGIFQNPTVESVSEQPTIKPEIASIEPTGKYADQQEDAFSIEADLANQLEATGQFDQETNQSYAALGKATYETLAKRLGITPEEAYARYPLQVSDQEVSGLQYKQETTEEHERKVRVEGIDDSYRLPNIAQAVPSEYVPPQARQKTVKIYRGVPANLTDAKIRPGDWVSLDKRYAKQHGTGATGKSRVIEMEVPADHVGWAGTDMNEWFYVPRGDSVFNQKTRGQITFGQDITKSPTVISLFKTADRSSFLHEMGHFQLEVLASIASQPNAPAGIVQDMDAALRWFGIQGTDTVLGGEQGGVLGQGTRTNVFAKYGIETPEVYAKLGVKAMEKLAMATDRMGYSFTPDDAREATADTVAYLKRAGIEGVDLYHVTDVTDFGSEGIRGSEVDNTGRSGGNTRARSVYFFLDPDDIPKAFDGVLGARDPSPHIAHVRIPVDEIARLVWDSNFNVTYGVYSGVRYEGDIAPDRIQSVKRVPAEAFSGILAQGDDATPKPGSPPPGRTPLETWQKMSLEEKRPYHEQFARGFEAYLFEGKAPSAELQGVFSRFKEWLFSIYKSIKNLGVEISPEIRGVYDRMLAAEETNEQRVEAAEQEGEAATYNQDIVPASESYDELAKKFAHAFTQGVDSRILKGAEKALADAKDLFEQVRGGTISHETSVSEADRLAGLLGWSPESVMEVMSSKLPEGFRPVDVMGAGLAIARVQSQKLLTAQNTDQFLTVTKDLLNLMMAVRAMPSEAGRLLGHYGWLQRQGGYEAPGSTQRVIEGPSIDRAKIGQDIAKSKAEADKATATAGKMLAEPEAKKAYGDVLSVESIKKALGGDKGIQKIMDAVKAQGPDVDLNRLVQYLNGMADSLVKNAKQEKSFLNRLVNGMMELFQAQVLTGWFTHEVNVLSNAANMAYEMIPLHLARGAMGQPGTLGAYKAFGTSRLLADIWAMAKYNAYEEMPASRIAHLIEQKDPTLLGLMRGGEGNKWMDMKHKYIPGKAGQIVRGVGFVPLGVEDAVFKTVAYRFELARQQAAGETQDLQKAIDFAEKLTFQSHSDMAAFLAKTLDKLPLLKPWALFVKTMTNILKRTASITPGLNLVVDMDKLKGKEGAEGYRDVASRMLVGTALMALIWPLIDDDDSEGEVGITGYAPVERRERAMFYEDRDQVSLRIGEDYYSFYRYSPVADFVGLVAAMKKSSEADSATKATGELAKGFYQAIVSKHFMSNVVETVDFVMWMAKYKEPEEEAMSALKYKAPNPDERIARGVGGFFASMLVPNMVPQIGDFTDEYRRQSRDLEGDILKKFPGYREDLPPLLSVSGEPVVNPRHLWPLSTNKRHSPKDEVSRWQMRLGKALEPDPISLRKLPQDMRQELLRLRWEYITFAYENTRGMSKEDQIKALNRVKRQWGEMVSLTVQRNGQ